MCSSDLAMGMEKEEVGGGLNGLANALRQVSPVYVFCDLGDLRAQAMLRAPASEKPTVFLYETYPGGVGFSDKLYTHHRRLFEAAVSLLSGCPCREGCPSCVGPDAETGPRGKRTALALARLVLGAETPAPPQQGDEA